MCSKDKSMRSVPGTYLFNAEDASEVSGGLGLSFAPAQMLLPAM